MIPYRILIPALLVGAMLLTIYVQQQRLDAALAQVEAEKAKRSGAQQELANATQVIQDLRSLEAEKAKQRASLSANLKALESERTRRQQIIRSLQREIEELRKWSDHPLPDIVVSMRERPALTGADAYREHLRDSGALPVVSGVTPEQRRSESVDRAD